MFPLHFFVVLVALASDGVCITEQVGEIKMRHTSILCLFALAATAVCTAAHAEPVVLVSKDGYTRMPGDLVKLDGEFYVVKTSVGQIRIPIADVDCEGAGCPDLSPKPVEQAKTALTQDQQLELFKAFLEWRKNSEDFRAFLEWRKNNAN